MDLMSEFSDKEGIDEKSGPAFRGRKALQSETSKYQENN
jgi:hypothetical protein